MDLVKLGNKWLHLFSIAIVIGAVILMRFIVLPALERANAEDSDAGRAIRRGYGILVGAAWLVVFTTGFLNLYLVASSVTKTYHMILGMKIAAVLLMFGLMMIVSHPIPALAALQKLWGPILMIVVVMGLIVLGVSAQLNLSRIDGSGLDKRPEPTTASPAPQNMPSALPVQ